MEVSTAIVGISRLVACLPPLAGWLISHLFSRLAIAAFLSISKNSFGPGLGLFAMHLSKSTRRSDGRHVACRSLLADTGRHREYSHGQRRR